MPRIRIEPKFNLHRQQFIGEHALLLSWGREARLQLKLFVDDHKEDFYFVVDNDTNNDEYRTKNLSLAIIKFNEVENS